MNPIIFIRIALMISSLCLGVANAQESAVFDSQRNAWKLYYQDPETAQWISKVYIQQNAIAPSIKSTVQADGTQYTYRYRVTNRREAKQDIDLIRIWGIPQVYAIPNLPPVTANIRTESDNWTRQNWAQLQFKSKFESSVVKAPKGWSANLRVDEKVNQTSFVWTLV